MAQRLARGAHNSEVTRSKRVAGIYHSPALQKRAGGMRPLRSASDPHLQRGGDLKWVLRRPVPSSWTLNGVLPIFKPLPWRAAIRRYTLDHFGLIF